MEGRPPGSGFPPGPGGDEPEELFEPVDELADEPLEDALQDEDGFGAPPSSGRGGLIPDGVKKALLAGVGALFMTEESARRLAREWKLPKEVIGYIGQQAQGAKEEVLRIFSDEVRRFLESEAVRREFLKALSSMAVEVKAEIRFVPTQDGAPRPEVKASVKPKRPARRKKGRG